MKNFEEMNRRMVEKLIAEGVLKSNNVINAFLSVKRHLFVPKTYIEEAYVDTPLPTANGQTISAPHMVAYMTELLKPMKNEKILEIGAGSGYQAAILSKLAKFVYTIEIDKQLCEFAKYNLKMANISNVKVIWGNGTEGYVNKMPYDKIIVTCSTPQIYDAWIQQLKNNGKLIAPVGTTICQILTEIEKDENGKIKKKEHIPCVFVPIRVVER